MTIPDRLELTVGPPAHGGHCVSRVDGRVVFVRHALPGERVVAVVTQERRGYWRADAVEVLTASAERVAPPCPYAGPGPASCGGCDLQHASVPAQLAWKADVVRDQLARLAGLPDVPVRVDAVPGGPLGWRSRVRYAVSPLGMAGLRAHRSATVVPVDECLIAVGSSDVLSRSWPPGSSVEVVASSGGDSTVLVDGSPVSGPPLVREHAGGREWTVDAGAFWQVHPRAADTLAAAVRELLAPEPGWPTWDLYGGAGLFSAVLADAVGPQGTVTLVESDPRGAAAARRNLADLRTVRVVHDRVERVLSRLPPPEAVVLDPPRTGAGAAVVRRIVAAGPRAVAYVACDPAAFARDVGTFRTLGWRLAALRAYDLFPMTQHVECVGLLVGPAWRGSAGCGRAAVGAVSGL